MSSDEMRVDLESFVNQGITEGWQGWPLKGQFPCQHEGIRSIYRARGATALCRDARGQALALQRRFDLMAGPGFRDFLR